MSTSRSTYTRSFDVRNGWTTRYTASITSGGDSLDSTGPISQLTNYITGGTLAAAGPPALHLASYIGYTAAPVKIPDLDILTSAWASGNIKEGSFYGMSRALGVIIPNQVYYGPFAYQSNAGVYDARPAREGDEKLAWAAYVDSHYFTPPFDLALDLVHRGLINETAYNRLAEYSTIKDVGLRDLLRKNYVSIPSPGEILAWIQRRTFTNNDLQLQGLLDGYKDDTYFHHYCYAHGLVGGETYAKDGTKFGVDYPALLWANRWSALGPNEAMEAYRRCQLRNKARFESAGIKFVSFGRDLLDISLAKSDLAPVWRQYAEMLSYKVPQQRHMLALLRSNLVDRDYALNIFLDQGYTPADASKVTDGYIELARRALSPAKLTTMWRRGLIAPDVYAAEMKRQGYSPQQIQQLQDYTTHVPALAALMKWRRRGYISDAEFIAACVYRGITGRPAQLYLKQAVDGHIDEIGVATRSEIGKALKEGVYTEAQAFNALVQIGTSEQVARAQISLWYTEQRVSFAQTALKNIRKQVITGAINAAQARARMTAIQLDDKEQDRRILLWTNELGVGRREFGAQKIVDLLKRALISVQEATFRLSNLGYDARSIAILEAAASQDVQRAVAKATIAAARTVQQEQTAARKLLSANRQDAKQARAALAAHGTPADLATWYWKCLITEKEMYARFDKLGWPRIDAERFIRGKKPAKSGDTPACDTGQQTNGNTQEAPKQTP